MMNNIKLDLRFREIPPYNQEVLNITNYVFQIIKI